VSLCAARCFLIFFLCSDPKLLTPEVIAIFKQAGVKKRDLKNRETASIAMNILSESFRQQEEEERRNQVEKSGRPSPPTFSAGSLVLSLDSGIVICPDCDEMFSVGSSCVCGAVPFAQEPAFNGNSPAPMPRSPGPRPVARVNALEQRGLRTKSAQPVSSMSKELDDGCPVKKPAGISPRPPVRPSSPPSVAIDNHRSAPSSPAPLPPVRKQPARASPPENSPPAPKAPSAVEGIGRGRGRGTGRGLSTLHRSGEGGDGWPVQHAWPGQQRRQGPGTDVSLMPPPPVMPEQVVAAVKRRSSVVELQRSSSSVSERRSTVSESSGFVPQLARRSALIICEACNEPNEPGSKMFLCYLFFFFLLTKTSKRELILWDMWGVS
jgi:hypothetical protein